MKATEHGPITPLLQKEITQRQTAETLHIKGRILINDIFHAHGAQSTKLEANNQDALSGVYLSIRETVNPELLHLPDDPSQGLELIVKTIIECGVNEELSEATIHAENTIREKTSNPNFSITGTLVDVLRREVNNRLTRERITDRSAGKYRRRSLHNNHGGKKIYPKGAGNLYDFENEPCNLGDHVADQE